MYLIAVLQPAQWVDKPLEERIEALKGEVTVEKGFALYGCTLPALSRTRLLVEHERSQRLRP